MDNITDLLSTLMSGGSQQPQPAAPGVQNSGVQALNSQIGTGNILARLKGGSAGQGPLGGIGGAAGGGMSAVKPDSSKFGAFAQGFGGGMKSAADQRAAQAKQNLEAMKAQWDQNYKLAQLEEQKNAHATLAKYYDGLIKNGADKNNKDSKNDDAAKSLHQMELARSARANNVGLNDKYLRAHAQGVPVNQGDMPPTPEQVQAAKDELAARQKKFDDWDNDAARPWNDGKKGKGTGSVAPSAPDAAGGGDDEGGDDNAPSSLDVPMPPKRPTDLDGAAPAVAETMRPVMGPDGKKYLWSQKSGLQPFDDGQAAAAPPDPSAAAPGMTPDTTLPGFAG